MNSKEKLELIKRNAAEIITEPELETLLKKKKSPIVYCGYELSGPMHLGHFVTITKLQDLQKAGFKVKILLADTHTLLNRKDKEIKKEIESWKKTIKAIGLKAEVIIGSEFQLTKEYQLDLIKLAQATTINRGLRSMQEVARDIQNATVSQVMYPLMQVIDIKYLKADVALGGMEQRKIHMIGRELQKTLNHDFIVIHTPLIVSPKGPQHKMSRSIPGTSISVTDSPETMKKTISKAYCPEKQIKDNPILQITKLIIFPRIKKFEIKRDKKFRGDASYTTYNQLESDFSEGKIHPADLKSATATHLEKIIAPIRKNFK